MMLRSGTAEALLPFKGSSETTMYLHSASKMKVRNWSAGKRHLAAGAVDTLGGGGEFSVASADSHNWALWAHALWKSRVYKVTQFCRAPVYPPTPPVDSRILILAWNNAPQIRVPHAGLFHSTFLSTSTLIKWLRALRKKMRAIIHSQLAKGALKASRLAGSQAVQATGGYCSHLVLCFSA